MHSLRALQSRNHSFKGKQLPLSTGRQGELQQNFERRGSEYRTSQGTWQGRPHSGEDIYAAETSLFPFQVRMF